MSTSRKKYDPEFRKEAIRLASEPGASASQIERELDLYQGATSSWKRQQHKERKKRMERSIVVKKMHSNEKQDENDEYISDPEECLDIVQKLRQEAEDFLYGNTSTFQRVIKVVRKA